MLNSPVSGSAAQAGLVAWPLALLAAMLPFSAAVLAWAISTAQGLVPACVPFIEGCTSISRSGRHGVANHLFRTLMMPAAVVQVLTWLLLARWLAQQLASQCLPMRGLRFVGVLAVVAGVALILYTSFLGVEGRTYRFLRQYGTVLYFGFTCINMLLAGSAIERLAAAGALPIPAVLRHALVALAVTLVSLGLVNAVLANLLGEPWKDRIENITEWWGSLIFVLAFAALARLWAMQGLRISLFGSSAAATSVVASER